VGPWLRLAVAVLACWRVSHLLAAEDGPWDAVARLRRAAGGGMLGKMMDCFYCVSVWVAAPLACFVASGVAERVVAWLAVSGGACLLERLAREPVTFPQLDEPSTVEPTMGCCGQSRDAYRVAEPAPYQPPPLPPRAAAPRPAAGASPAPGTVRLRFLQRARVRVRGPATGADYEFSGSEPVRVVNAADAEALLRTGHFGRAY